MNKEDPFDLNRFISAQAEVFQAALHELRAGRKRTHWMWFIFPQLSGLGSSPMSRRYAINSLDEAQAYLNHPVLGPRLVLFTETVLNLHGESLHAIFGSPDDKKFCSSMTLFATACGGGNDVFQRALERYCDSAQER